MGMSIVEKILAKHAGKEKVVPGENKVIVKDCKVAKKTVKPDQEKNPDGGFINKEMPIDISNVAKVEG
jgi:large subunit ribosomal protein L24